MILMPREDLERHRRLPADYNQPELATHRMDSWEGNLYEKVQQMRVKVLHTSGQTFDRSLGALEREIASILDTCSDQEVVGKGK